MDSEKILLLSIVGHFANLEFYAGQLTVDAW